MILITHLLASGLRLQQRLSQQTAEGIAKSAYCQFAETKTIYSQQHTKPGRYSLYWQIHGLTFHLNSGVQLTIGPNVQGLNAQI